MQYVIADDSETRFAQYLLDFLRKEEKNIAQLRSFGSPDLTKDLEQRAAALSLRRKIVDDLLSELKVDSRTLPEWPSLMARCKALGLEADYRLYYYQLSAQIHADPEDPVNELVATASHTVERLALETVAFSWMLTKAGLGFYLRALADFSVRLASGRSESRVDAAAKELDTLEFMSGGAA